MVKNKVRDKKLIYVPQDIIDQIFEVAKRKGETISRFVEDALLEALKAEAAGYEVKKLGAFFEVLHALKVLGGVFFPLEIASYLVNNASARDLKSLHKKWLTAGEWYGKYLKQKFEDPVSAFKIFLEACRWDLNEVEIKRNSECKKLMFVSSVMSSEETEMLAIFAEGVIRGMGYTLKGRDVVKGIVALDF